MNKVKLKEIRDEYEYKARKSRNDFEMVLTSWDAVELIDAILADQPPEEQNK